jgi:monoamine oxidase
MKRASKFLQLRSSVLQANGAPKTNISRGKQRDPADINSNILSNKHKQESSFGNNPSREIVIVGAGLAGLVCAYRLKKAGIRTKVFEAQNRVGGRCWTERNFFGNNQFFEHGGEFIDSNHKEILRLIEELGLSVVDSTQKVRRDDRTFFYINGTKYTHHELSEDLKEVWPKIVEGLQPDQKRRLDHISIWEWIDKNIPLGHQSQLGKLLDVAYTELFGMDTMEQSSLNLLQLLGNQNKDQFVLFGISDERYRVSGGSDRIIQRLVEELEDQIILESSLVSIKHNSDGRYTLLFQQDHAISEVITDYVALTVPFSILRSRVDYKYAGFSEKKRQVIEELEMGNNTKAHLLFTERYWGLSEEYCDIISDIGYHSIWDATSSQTGNTGILSYYNGGKKALSIQLSEILEHTEALFPSILNCWMGKSHVDRWAENDWTRGSYSMYKVGQYTRFGNWEQQREQNCFFAGEHTSRFSRGYMNGAVETGEQVAQQLLRELRI